MGMASAAIICMLVCSVSLSLLAAVQSQDQTTGITRHYDFHVQMVNVTRLCDTKSVVTVNGQFPGPEIVVHDGDRIVVNVSNNVEHNITMHWHGVRQLRSGWADGPVYVTQCPIQTGRSYVYNFTVTGQVGTLWWHAHASWLRATVYGPLVILPKPGVPYSFPTPDEELPPIMFGEWWKADVEDVIRQALFNGGGPNVSDAYTFNGLPGPSYNCSAQDTLQVKVQPGRRYLLRLINAALNDELFFSIANHTLTVVAADAVPVKPFSATILMLSPGQTTDVLLDTNPAAATAAANFIMSVAPFVTTSGTFDNSTASAVLQYGTPAGRNLGRPVSVNQPSLPASNDTAFVARFLDKFRSLKPRVPSTVDRRFLFTVGLGSNPCPANRSCQGPNGTKFAASINNVSFALPTGAAMLESHYRGMSRGVYTPDFPNLPLAPFNFTGTPPNNTFVINGTKAVVLPFGAAVEVVLQDQSIYGAESHPLHIHGHNFHVVGTGSGNFDPAKDPSRFNLVDPAERNTVGVPAGGWVAVRFRADNPGVWLMHCHLDVHLSWGLRMAWVVLDGESPDQKLPPPPADLPKC